ncbi:type IV pilus secretin PilQ [Acidithiobacillus ferrivorans SS3]|uniref:Type IV pilus secretin PilQ n=1 Tax=Acidithiobacillus ferrivorans SS3 TaxID=743299 RepID=G0JN63_9PROT|nr:type IV pilus secretin PilQ family protein [Acidithiobacillus ferrivorans]AEM48277.1 type IV pilus secretin PilQ [Acidithiobacillus ferrivorans SS3]OFA17132.1 fimbrial protein [Acidithiobacillus ferrivorans]
MSTASITARHARRVAVPRLQLHPLVLRPVTLAVMAAALCLSSGAAWAESLITGVTPVQDQHGTALLIRSNSRPAYDVNTLDGGYRLRIDFNNAHFMSSVGTIASSGAIENVLAENIGHNARLDLLLKSPQAIMVAPTPGGYRLALVAERGKGGVGVTPSAPSAASVPTSNAAATPALPVPVQSAGTQINDLNFKRGKNGGGILNLSISGPQPQMNVTRQNGALVVDLKDTVIPSSYTHRFGVGQFGTPVQYVDSYPLGRSTRLVFAIHGPYEYSAYQLGQRTMIDVHPKTTETGSNPDSGARLSMDFQNISVRDALQVIADFTHQNIVVSNNVSGSLSLRLKNEPWEEALQVILESQGLAEKHIGNILWVAPANQIASQEEAQLKAAASKRKLEPLETELIQIKYAKASEIASLLQGFDQNQQPGIAGADNSMRMNPSQNAALASALGIPSSSLIGNSLLGPRGSVAVVTRTNSLLVRDTPQDITNIKNLIAKIDRPVPQVLIEARIVQITTNAAQSLGVNWGGTYTGGGGGGVVNLSGTGGTGVTSTQGGAYPMSGTSTTSGTGFTTPALVNLIPSTAGSALAGSNPASLGFALGTAAGNRILNLQLQALQANNRAKIISSPKVLTQDNEKAVIEQGQEIPYQQSTSSGATAVSFKKAELSLNVTPHISPNGKITLDVDAQNNQPNYAQALPSGIPIDTQQVKTKLLVNNGQTVVIGGIYTDSTTQTETGVPLLRDIPLLGWLFKSHLNNVAKTELLVFLTPKVIGGDAPDGLAGTSGSANLGQ